MDIQGFEKNTAGVDNLTQTNDFYKSPPEPTLPPIHPLIELQQVIKEHKEAKVKFALKKIFLKRHELDIMFGWKNLEDQKGTLKKQIVLSNNGIKENKASMARFYEIINEEKKTRDKLEIGIISTKVKIEEYKEVQKDLKHYVEIYSVYENFLENVAQVGESWRSVSDILTRYETLQKTSIECARLLGYQLEQFMDLRKEMVAIVHEKSEKLKNLNNRLILLQVHSKDVRDKREHWEHMMGRMKNAVLDKTQEAVFLTGGMYDLYRSMCKRLNIVATIPECDVETQLDFIHKTILFYKEVVNIATSSKTIQQVKKVVDKKKSAKKRTK